MKISGFIVTLLLATDVSAKVVPASLFQDRMVLQRGMKVPVWGKAKPSEEVTVTFAGQSKSVQADKDGKWMLYLDELKAINEGQKMNISGSNSVVLDDVVVGEVWLCSGQSNMQMEYKRVPEVKEFIKEMKNVRSFEVAKTVAFDEQETLKGNWKSAVPQSAVAASFAVFLEQKTEVPVGVIISCWGSSSLEAWMPRDMTEHLPGFKRQMKEFDSNRESLKRIQSIIDSPRRPMADDIFIRRQPNIAYNAMIAPLVPYACRGVIWYQGERNAHNFDEIPKEPWYRRTIPMTGYGKALKLWIERYRKEWKRDDLHFMIVALPGYAKGLEKKADSPTEHSWAWMREAQFQALELPHTSVVNTIDLGHRTNIHPPNKLPIGRRLALMAERDTLSKDVVAEGPVMSKVVQDGKSLVVNFKYAEGLTTKDGQAPKGFWLSTNARKWYPATAVLDGDKVKLTASKLARPRYVRYAFAALPQMNLVNSSGLPARPFRTDTNKK